MKKFFVVILALWGAYFYVTKYYNYGDALKWASKNKQSSLAPKVEYYVGLMYHQRSEYGKAQETFTLFLTDFPTAQYAPRALIRLADSAENNFDWTTAKDSLTRYLETYPDGKDAEVAKKKLDFLNYKHP